MESRTHSFGAVWFIIILLPFWQTMHKFHAVITPSGLAKEQKEGKRERI